MPRIKLITRTMAREFFVERPGERSRNMNPKEFDKLLKNLNENPLNSNTHRYVKVLEKRFKNL